MPIRKEDSERKNPNAKDFTTRQQSDEWGTPQYCSNKTLMDGLHHPG
jgi:hypothetical protein